MKKGKLYLVPTPIGNLKDITLRSLAVLNEADVIAAEDTRQTLKLLNHYNIKKTLISYHKFNEKDRSADIINRLESGNKIALVSDAGMPGISDPGEVIVKQCIERGLEFEVLPGASAFPVALIYSGFDISNFTFIGFLPRENKNKNPIIEELKDRKENLIFYEAPHRLLRTLEFLKDNLGNRNIAICRELTKIHEEIKRLTLEESIQYYNENNPRGEYVLIVEGKSKEEIEKEIKEKWENLTIEQHITKYIKKGLNKKEAIKKVAKDRKIKKAEVYKKSLNIKVE